MKKKDQPMKSSLVCARVNVDKEADARLARVSENVGRTKQRQMGIILERVADLIRTNPQAVRDLGLLDPQLACPAI